MKKHILLIDDDEDELDIFNEALNALPVNFACSQAKNTEQAVELTRSFSPDYIFIDYNMPRTNGLECLQTLKKIKALSDVRFIIYSNFIDDVTSRKAVSLGATACMKKPYLTSILSQRLKELLLDKNV
jgi:PleD family two-component response regulator